MGKRESIEIFLIAMYITGAVLLMVASYVIYTRKYRRRGKMEMLNNLVFTTSRYDIYSAPAQFLLDSPKPTTVSLVLLNQSEEPVKELFSQDISSGQHMISFNPAEFKNGIYYLSLKTDNANILRRITIENPN